MGHPRQLAQVKPTLWNRITNPFSITSDVCCPILPLPLSDLFNHLTTFLYHLWLHCCHHFYILTRFLRNVIILSSNWFNFHKHVKENFLKFFRRTEKARQILGRNRGLLELYKMMKILGLPGFFLWWQHWQHLPFIVIILYNKNNKYQILILKMVKVYKSFILFWQKDLI